MKLTKTLASLLIGFLLSIIVFAGSIYFTYKTEENLFTDFKGVEQIHEVIENSKTFISTFNKLESSLRGYAYTKNEAFIDDYRAATTELQQALSDYKQSLTIHPDQGKKISELENLIRQKLVNMDEKIELLKSGKNYKDELGAKFEKGRQISQQVNSIESQIVKQEQLILDKKHADTVNNLKKAHLTIEIIGSSALAMSILIIVFFFEYAKRHARIEQDLIELNDNKNKFFSIISHDLRNPVKNIVLMAQLLTDQTNAKSYDPTKIANMIQGSANNLSSLLDNLLKWSRLQMNKIEFVPEKLDLQKVADDVIRHQGINATQKNIAIVNHIEKNVFAYVDQNMITTVLRNLISNGIKFTNKGGVIDIHAHALDEDIELTVTDNGVGMPADIAQKIFSIDFKHTTKGTNKEEGTGLGLKLCREFIEKNGGKIRVESTLHAGTKFIVSLPAVHFKS